MTFSVRTADGHTYLCHTEVGDGLARVILEEQQEPEDGGIEGDGDE